MTRLGRLFRAGLWSAALALLVAGGAGAALVADAARDLPAVPEPAAVATSTIVVDRDGKLLRPFTIADGRWRLPVTKADVDPRFLAMLFGYEDRRFATHSGIDYLALSRAALQFLAAGGHIVSGASTLTMQVARLIEGGSTRSLSAKVRQILIARKLEARLSKDQILTLYLTLAPYGGNLEGVRAASLAY
jgi:penicillin-binding protein 1C